MSERIMCFIWFIVHDQLLTNLNKSLKGLGGANCKLCGNAKESTLHALRDCHKAMQLWRHKVP